ncbi:uncharacterized protein LOC126319924 [Schistocerca gregaria]|uniref:uncharacterized protein LOC126319924 n=1 Tax=Schistocerca gregaria TaxID=7010 RepID=UPI00211EDDEA|nr:uncharacterized protein LOC126319924 [Schistocerca gregaria]
MEIIVNPFASRVFEAALKAIEAAGDSVELSDLQELVSSFTKNKDAIWLLDSSVYALKSLQKLMETLNRRPEWKRLKLSVRRSILHHANLNALVVTPHGSSFVQFVLLDSYHSDEKDYQLPDPVSEAGFQPKSVCSVRHSPEWNQMNGSAEYKIVHTMLTVDVPQFLDWLQDPSVAHLTETLILISPASAYDRMLKDMSERLVCMARHPVSHFVVQKLIECVQSLEQYRRILDRLGPCFPELVHSARGGVVLKLARAAIRYPEVQDEVCQHLSKAAATDHSAKYDWVIQLAKLRQQSKKPPSAVQQSGPKKKAKKGSTPIGMQILGELLQFQQKIASKIAAKILECEAPTLIDWTLDSVASRTMEAFFYSDQIPQPKKDRLIQIWQESSALHQLVLDKNGSHVVDACFRSANVNTKEELVKQLLPLKQNLRHVPHGKFVISRVNMDLYDKNPSEWRKHQEASIRHKKAFLELLNFDPNAQKKKRTKHETNEKEAKKIKRNETKKKSI